ncbi:MAG TPA: thiamine pyrophosphate-requiring protein [Gammaproteobacteria bacterium]|nr:thiamine pyrophosphate-requiring protein [Gammaproteobacteria bacterium]
MDGAKAQQQESVAEAFLRSLKRRGIDYVLANAGTDFAPVIEGLVAMAGRGEPVPTFLTVPHENLAVAMAHGYYQVAGKPAAVMVHVTVGTGNTVCALMNAARDNVPLLLMAGRTPHTQSGHIASRSAPIHWGQENFDQAGVVREYTKWDYELRAGQPVDEIVGRALDIALSEPRGPVYLTLPREVLADRDTASGAPLALTELAPPQPSTSHVSAIARMMARAEWPVILTSNLGRDRAAVAALARLAERHAIPVIQPHPSCVNLPASHEMNLGHAGVELLGKADVIVVVDCEVPWYPRYVTPRADARVVHLGVDPLFARYPIRSFPGEMAVAGSSRAALAMLDEALRSAGPNENAANRIKEGRRGAVEEFKAAKRAAKAAMLAKARSEKPIRYPYLGDCLRAALPKKSTVIVELGVPIDSLELEEPGSLLGVSIGGGLGFGLGASLGAKLAAPDRMVVATVGDGSYMFGNPTPFHFVSRAANLPTLTIVCNNMRWQAVESATRVVYPQGLSAAAQPMPLVELQPSPEFTKVAEASDAWTRRVDEPADVPRALDDALAAVAGGRQALLDVRMEHGIR